MTFLSFSWVVYVSGFTLSMLIVVAETPEWRKYRGTFWAYASIAAVITLLVGMADIATWLAAQP